MTSSNSHRGLPVAVLFAAIAQVLWPTQAAAQSLPTGPSSVVQTCCTPTINTVGNTMTVTLGSSRTITNWTSFNVGQGYTFNVVGASANDLMVNRVTGGTSSSIDGTIAGYVGAVGGAKGVNLWLLNPNGIAVGSTGVFDVGGLLLSTADATNADILDGDNSFALSGGGSTGISIAQGAQLTARNGGVFVQGNFVDSSGTLVSPGTNALIGSGGMTVTFDANLGAITTLDLGAGSSQATAVTVGSGAAFTGTRNVITAAGMTTGQGNVLLQNFGGANDIVFNAGSVELVSRNAGVTARSVFTTPGDLTITAGEMIDTGGGATVGGNYSVTAKDFTGGAFQPVLLGSNSSFSITDTAGGLSIAGDFVHGRGDLDITTTNGGSLSITDFGTPLASDNGAVRLTTVGGGSIALSGGVRGTSVVLDSSSTITQTAGAIVTGSLLATARGGMDLGGANAWTNAQFANSTSGNVNANSTTAWTLVNSSNSAGSLSFQGPQIGVAGNVLATGNIGFTGNVVLNGDTVMQSVGGNVLLDGTVDGNGGSAALTVDAASGATFTGNVGGTTALTSLTVNGAGTFNGTALNTTGAVDLDGVTLGGTGWFMVSAGGRFDAAAVNAPNASVRIDANGIGLASLTAGDYNGGVFKNAVLNAGTGGVQLGSGYAASFNVNGAGNLAVTGALETIRLSGAMGGSATLSGDNRINSIGPFSSNGLVLRDLNSLSIDNVVDAGAGDARIEVVGDSIQIDAGGQVRGANVALSAHQFFNSSGADAITTPGHWVVYLTHPLLTSVFDGLDSGQTALWGQTISTAAPSSITGNRYVFAFRPTLTFTTTGTTKTYGTDLTGSAASFFTVTGYQPGVAGAYLGDTAASAFSGAPTVTSSGFASRATVAGGPYAVNIGSGSLVGLNGYNLAFNSPGQVTVNPKTLTGTATTTTKTYDGNANGSGGIALSGVVAGDTVGATGTFTFVDKNAGLGKTVNLTGTTLTGADAGNYTLSVPATTIGDILQKAITGTGTVTTKTYDGNANGSGTITLSGVVSGDDLGASGTFTFSDRNAGTNKAVTLSGVTLTGADAGNYTLTVPASLLGDILQKAISGTVTVATKTYDGNANGSGSVTLGSVVAGDDVTGSATFTFSDKSAGAGKTVTVSGATLSGADAGNYTLTLPASALGDILRKAITGTPVVTTKTYDGNANGSGAIGLTGVVAGDDVNASGTFTFADKSAGTGKTVNVTGTTLDGADAGNYTLTVPSSVLGDILQKVINGTAVVTTRTYDGTTNGSGTVTLSGVVTGDDLGAAATFTFADKNAGAGKTVTVSSVTLIGADAGNYAVNVPASALGDILRKAITGTVTVDTRTYDGTTAATGTVGLTGTVAGDDVAATGTLAFADRNAGTGKTVNVTGTTLTGADAGNYTLTVPATATGNILQKAITGTTTVTAKTYDGTRTGTGSIALNGVVAGDAVGATGSFVYADKNAGVGKTVTISGVTLTGADAGNYSLSVPATVLGDILRKSITGVATVDTRAYDGTTAGTGSIALSGVVAGDSVGATGTYTFSDANAGTGKRVTVGGVSLTGADAGNYSVVVSGATVADILQRAITVTADPLSKPQGSADPELTYSLTSGSFVAGDSLGGALVRDAGETPGQYQVGQGTLSASANYRLTFVGSTLTITQASTVEPRVGTEAVVGYLRSANPAQVEQATTLRVVDERPTCAQGDEHASQCGRGGDARPE